jgi:hypothetical protein
MTDLRNTQEVVQVLYDRTPELYVTQEVVQVLYDAEPNLNLTQEIVQVVYTLPPPPIRVGFVCAEIPYTLPPGGIRVSQVYVEVLYKVDPTSIKLMQGSFSANANVSANLTIPKLNVNFRGTGYLAGRLTGVWQLNADITASGNLSADVKSYVRLTSNITADGDITTAGLRKNIEYIDSAITAAGDITNALMFVPWHGGDTLALRQTTSVNIVKLESVESLVNLLHNVNLVFGQRSLRASNTIIFTHLASTLRALPTKTASSTLSLSHLLSDYREVKSYLNFTQRTSGSIYYISATATSVLNLSDLAQTGVIVSASGLSQLNLTHLAELDQITEKAVTSTLVFAQNVFSVILASKKYILLQAPFSLIQTSVILPNPLLDDNESLVSDFTLRRTMSNVPYTYVKTTKNRRLRYTFTLNRMKALELEAFFDAYNGADIKMLNWKGEIWKVKLINNPIDFTQTRRAEPGGDRTDVNLEFEGVLLNG